MKKRLLLKNSCLLAGALLCLFLIGGEVPAAPLEVKIRIVSASPPRARVEGRRAEGATAWSLRNFYGSAAGLAERVENLSLADDGGAGVPARKLAPGEFLAERAATRFSYDFRLDPPAFINDAAHVSWLAGEHGVLMLADLLPLPLSAAKVSLALPAGWGVSTLEPGGDRSEYDVRDAERAVFVIGRDLRVKRRSAGRTGLNFTAAGEWAFGDDEAADSAVEILKTYAETMGGTPRGGVMLALLPWPQPIAANLWSAEARGGTVVLVSGRLPSKLAATAQLNAALAHELFHLWVPNGLALDSDYDWFYEGFANYQSLRAGLRLGHLTFQDYLAAIGRAFDIYKSARGAKEITLAEASQRRWSGGSRLVYSKGMLVAALYDLNLMLRTGGRRSIDEVFRELFERHREGREREDGNAAVVRLLGGVSGMEEFTARFVRGAEPIDLAQSINAFGLVVEPGGVRTHLGVAKTLERPQRELLRKLGYNENLEAEARKAREQLKGRRPPE
ncbi:MAG TPA: hypothetical protein VD968_10580 [Pyrinomonadaceae bacterium]|nr:hypothetical protein [Pyrinomonadaceae bacterium]